MSQLYKDKGGANPVQNPVTVTELQPTEHHRYPCFDGCWQEDERAVLDDKFEVCVKELEYKVEVRL